MASGGTDRRAVLLGLLVAVVLTWGTVAAVVLPGRPVPTALPAPAVPSRAPLLPPAGDGRPVSAAGVQRALAAGLRAPALGGPVELSVLDATTGAVVWERDAGRAVTPASTAKLLTAAVALRVLGDQQRFVTRVLAGERPGEVVLVGGGDASLAGPLAGSGYPRPARLGDLAAQVRAALRPAAVSRVLVDDSRYAGPPLGPGWRPGYVSGGDVAPVTALMVDGGRTARPDVRAPRVADPAVSAGRQLARLLGAPAASVARGRAPVPARELAAVRSPTTGELVEAMLTRSDNDLAEALARQVALARGRPASFAGAAAAFAEVLPDVLAAAGAPGGSARLVDGSGLSRLDLVQPAALSRLLAAAAGADRGRLGPLLSGPLLSGLPVAGFDGTLDDRFRSGAAAAAAGQVRAKTGTLNGVGALAGLVRTRDGRLLAFAFAAPAVPAGGTRAAQAALDRLAAALAACGCP